MDKIREEVVGGDMNRTDRLVAMVLHLQGRRVVRAEELAREFEISDRTVYRDIAALGEAGVPVIGEAGVGYSLARGYHLPPVMFTADEALALSIGEGLVRAMTDDSVAGPMGKALVKIRSVLPVDHQDTLDRLRQATAVVAPIKPGRTGGVRELLLPVQRAAIARAVLEIHYQDREGTPTTRTIEPLGVIYFNDSWYAVAWCRMREGLRHFRIDRMTKIERTGEKFPVRTDFDLSGHLEAEANNRGESLEVVVRMNPGAADSARRERWLTIKDERVLSRREVELTLQVYSLTGAAWWILSMAGGAHAVSPPELRAEVAAMATGIAKKHQEAISS